MSHSNGEKPHGPLELSEVLTIETSDGQTLSFEVVGILEDPAEGTTYAVLRHETSDADGEDEFIVTDVDGNLLDDDRLAQEILDDFLAAAQDEDDDSPAGNGERS